ncbi:type II secretion system protein [Anabaena sp. UHCC 0451]|uniref:pilus assembly FimT family protein n=1 Tax=Anabaena sp. UHCC 0451 TaxID=2055235 RepID=UPI002B2098F4|nr:type II secretion system protein [Anabaena sp. UHCC 0451]MEA5575422.1 type II secretion system protein [Anabaena sp. UHCC 0451]
MRHSNVFNDNQGFTILEALIVVVFIGILGAMAGPSYFAWSQRRTVESAITNIEGAIKEAQRQAISRSRTCNVTLDTATPRVRSTTTNVNCLLTGDRTLSNVSLAASATAVDFDYLGNSSMSITVVVAPTANASSDNFRKCLVLSTPLGLIRTGNYTGASGTTAPASCTQ